MKAVFIKFKRDRGDMGGELYILVPDADGLLMLVSDFSDNELTIPGKGSYGHNQLQSDNLVQETLTFEISHRRIVDILTGKIQNSCAVHKDKLDLGSEELKFLEKHFSYNSTTV